VSQAPATGRRVPETPALGGIFGAAQEHYFTQQERSNTRERLFWKKSGPRLTQDRSPPYSLWKVREEAPCLGVVF